MGSVHTLPPLGRDMVEPFRSPIYLRDDGTAWVPDAFTAGAYRDQFICEGVAMGWVPIQELGKAILVFAGGNPLAPTDEAVAVALSPRGLRELIADLQSIEQQWRHG